MGLFIFGQEFGSVCLNNMIRGVVTIRSELLHNVKRRLVECVLALEVVLI